MAIATKELMNGVIKPALLGVGLYSEAAMQLLAGTAAIESQFGTYLRQYGGPALGIWQMEPDTHKDIYKNFLNYRPKFKAMITSLCNIPDYGDQTPPDALLLQNLFYACIMARVKYMRVKDDLPAFGDIAAQANYWKTYYNTQSGKGDTVAYQIAFERFVKPYYNNK